MDKLLALNLAHQNDHTLALLNRHIDFNQTVIDPGSFDLVELGFVHWRSIDRVLAELPSHPQIVTKLPLHTFIVTLELMGAHFNILFRCYEQGEFRIPLNFAGTAMRRLGGRSLSLSMGENLVDVICDAYILTEQGEVTSIIQFFRPEGSPLECGVSRPAALSAEVSMDLLQRHEDMDWVNASRNVWGIYIFTQNQLVECQEVFRVVERTATMEPQAARSHSNRKPKRSKTPLVRHVYTYVDADDPPGNTKSHEINCPCYSVRGHWRKYKSGKIVWVQPYLKGKERHNPDYFSPKTYTVPTSD